MHWKKRGNKCHTAPCQGLTYKTVSESNIFEQLKHSNFWKIGLRKRRAKLWVITFKWIFIVYQGILLLIFLSLKFSQSLVKSTHDYPNPWEQDSIPNGNGPVDPAEVNGINKSSTERSYQKSKSSESLIHSNGCFLVVWVKLRYHLKIDSLGTPWSKPTNALPYKAYGDKHRKVVNKLKCSYTSHLGKPTKHANPDSGVSADGSCYFAHGGASYDIHQSPGSYQESRPEWAYAFVVNQEGQEGSHAGITKSLGKHH